MTGMGPYRPQREMSMSKAVAIVLPAQTTLFGRLLAIIDRALMTSAEAAIRNGEPTYFGL